MSDPVDELFSSDSTDITTMAENTNLTIPHLKRLLMLQDHKLGLLKRAKSYWDAYKYEAGEVNIEVSPRAVCSENTTTQPLKEQESTTKSSTTSNSGPIQAIPQQSRKVPTVSMIPIQPICPTLCDNSIRTSYQPCHVQQPFGAVSRELLNRYSLKLCDDNYMKDVIAKLEPPLTTEFIPRFQQYICPDTIFYLTASLVNYYHTHCKYTKFFVSDQQKKLIHHESLPVCNVCSSTVSPVWFKIPKKDTQDTLRYSCSRCVHFYDDSAEIELPRLSKQL